MTTPNFSSDDTNYIVKTGRGRVCRSVPRSVSVMRVATVISDSSKLIWNT